MSHQHHESIEHPPSDPVGRVPRLHNGPVENSREQVQELGEKALVLLDLQRKKGRWQMGLSTVSQFVPLILRPGTHVMALNERSNMNKLDQTLESFYHAAERCGIHSDTLDNARAAKDQIGNPHTTGLSLATSLLLPITRAAHRAVQEGKFEEVEFHVRSIMRQAGGHAGHRILGRAG